MASKTVLTVKNLEVLGDTRLAKLSIEISTGGAIPKGRQRLELVDTQSTGQTLGRNDQMY